MGSTGKKVTFLLWGVIGGMLGHLAGEVISYREVDEVLKKHEFIAMSFCQSKVYMSSGDVYPDEGYSLFECKDTLYKMSIDTSAIEPMFKD